MDYPNFWENKSGVLVREFELKNFTEAVDFVNKVAKLAEADFAREVRYTNSAGDSFANSVGDILTHVAMHGVHHRGQIAASLRANGAEPPALDYIRFARGK